MRLASFRCDQDVVSDFGPPQQAAAATMRVIESHSGLNSTTHWRYLMIFGAVGISGSSMCFDISNRLVNYKHYIRYTLIQFAGTCRNWNPLLFVLRFIYHVSHRFALKMWMLFGSTPHERRGILSPPVRPLVLDWRMKQRHHWHHSSYWFIIDSYCIMPKETSRQHRIKEETQDTPSETTSTRQKDTQRGLGQHVVSTKSRRNVAGSQRQDPNLPWWSLLQDWSASLCVFFVARRAKPASRHQSWGQKALTTTTTTSIWVKALCVWCFRFGAASVSLLAARDRTRLGCSIWWAPSSVETMEAIYICF